MSQIPVGARSYTDVTRGTFDGWSGDVGSGHFVAHRLMERIEDGLTESVVQDLLDDDIHLVGLEFEVDAGVDDPPFPSMTGTIGLAIVWFLPDGLGPGGGADPPPAGPPTIRAFAAHGTGGLQPFRSDAPGADLEADEVGANGVLFVGHHTGDPSTVSADSWFDALVTASVGAGETDRFIVGDESYGVPVSQQGSGRLSGLGGWYCFGGSLEATGDDEAQQVAYSMARYRHFHWLLWRLGLAAPTADMEEDVEHDSFQIHRGGSVVLVPDWSAGMPTSGGFAIADDCRAYEPFHDDTIVVDSLEHAIPDDADPPVTGSTNWQSDSVHHFTEDTPLDCRDPADVEQFVLHETQTPDWTMDRQERHEEGSENLGIQLVVLHGGEVYVHNDVVEEANQAGDLNATSFGVEIVTPYFQEYVDDESRWETIENTGWLSKTYYRPTHDQLESVSYLVDWFATSDRHDLGVTDDWLGFESDVTDTDDEDRDGFRMWYGIGSTDPDPGIWAHTHMETTSRRVDGLFPALYTWLRLEANDTGLAADAALEAAVDLVDEDNDDTESFRAKDDNALFVDVGEYT